METPCYNTVDRVPLMDINMAVGNQHSHLLSILAKKRVNLWLKEIIKSKVNTFFWYKDCSDSKIQGKSMSV